MREVTDTERESIGRALGDPFVIAGHPLTCNGGNPDLSRHHDREIRMLISGNVLVCPECSRHQELPQAVSPD